MKQNGTHCNNKAKIILGKNEIVFSNLVRSGFMLVVSKLTDFISVILKPFLFYFLKRIFSDFNNIILRCESENYSIKNA